MRFKITPFACFGVSLGIIVSVAFFFCLKVFNDGAERAQQRREREASSSSISLAMLVFKVQNGTDPKRISDLKLGDSANLAPFKFYTEGEKIGSSGRSIFAETPMWSGSSTNWVIYFDGTISEE